MNYQQLTEPQRYQISALLELNMPGRDIQHLSVAIAQIQQRQGAGLRLVLMQQVQVFVDRTLTELGLEVGLRLVALEVVVVLQSVWAVLLDIAVDIFRRLLATDIEGATEVVGGQAPLPLQHDFQQTKTQRLIPGQSTLCLCGDLLWHGAIHSLDMSIDVTHLCRWQQGVICTWISCLKTRHVYVSKIDMSFQGAHNQSNGQTTLNLKNAACNRSLS